MPESLSGLQEPIATARSRMRRQRLVRTAGLWLRGLAGFLVVALAVMAFFPQFAPGIGLVLGLVAGGACVSLVVAWIRPIPDHHVARAVDVQFGLPDHTLSASELPPEAGTEWLRLQHADTVARLTNLDWKTRWPVVWPKFSAAAGVAVLLLSALVAFRFAFLPVAVTAATSGPNEDAAAIEEILADWEKAAELTEDPELKALLAELQPLRDQLPTMNEREMLLALSKLENKLEALRESAAKDSMETSAADMAAALENVDGMGALAAALRRKEFEEAAKLAEKEAQKLGEKGAKTPAGSDSASTQQQMSKASEKLSQSGQHEAASAMNQTREGGQKKDPSQMSKGLARLGQSLAKSGQSQAAQARLGLQLAQLGECKGGMGQKPGEGMGRGMSLLPKLSEQKGKGKGAGSETDPDRAKAATDLGSERSLEGLTGQAGAGDSLVETLASDTPGSEAPREGRSAQFAQYEKLSQQAITDENLPLAYRESIRKYFEAIKPPPSAE